MRTLLRRLFKITIRLAIVQAILLGFAFVARQFIQEWGDEESNEFQLAAIIDGRELRSRAPALRGGSAIAAYGGVELDLREARLAAGGAVLSFTAVFGGIALLVPDGWRVNMTTAAILGGAEQRTTPEEELPEDAPELTINATVVFGGVAVRAKAPAQSQAA